MIFVGASGISGPVTPIIDSRARNGIDVKPSNGMLRVGDVGEGIDGVDSNLRRRLSDDTQLLCHRRVHRLLFIAGEIQAWKSRLVTS